MYGKRKSECLKRFQASPVVLVVKNLPSNAGNTKDTWVHPLEKAMATHSSILAWKFPWKEEPSWGHKELDMTEHSNNNMHIIVRNLK